MTHVHPFPAKEVKRKTRRDKLVDVLTLFERRRITLAEAREQIEHIYTGSDEGEGYVLVWAVKPRDQHAKGVFAGRFRLKESVAPEHAESRARAELSLSTGRKCIVERYKSKNRKRLLGLIEQQLRVRGYKPENDGWWRVDLATIQKARADAEAIMRQGSGRTVLPPRPISASGW